MAYECFTDLEEFKIFVRRVDKLLPHEIDLVHENSMVQAREAFYKLRDDTTRQRLAADVEIKLRGLYYDMVEPPVIEAVVNVGAADNTRAPDKPEASTVATSASNAVEIVNALLPEILTVVVSTPVD